MLYVITGGSGSGKSAYAEEKIVKLCESAGGGTKLYVATMIPYGEETRRKIARHRKMRAEKAFLTKECYTDLCAFAEEQIFNMEEPPFVLLECMSNLIANEMFGGVEQDSACDQGTNRTAECLSDSLRSEEMIVERVMQGIRKLLDVCRDVVVVTNEVFSESAEDTAEMQEYKQVLAQVNRRMAEQAIEVTEVVYGIPYRLYQKKGRVVKEKRMQTAGDRSMGMKLIIGGAFQGKSEYAEKQYPGIRWTDGAECELAEIFSCEGMCHFETYVRRLMLREWEKEAIDRKCPGGAGKEAQHDRLTGLDDPARLDDLGGFEEAVGHSNLAERILKENPQIILIGNEIGCGLVPVDAFERNYREQYGRICTKLAQRAQRVDRVVCGIGVRLKPEGMPDDR